MSRARHLRTSMAVVMILCGLSASLPSHARTLEVGADKQFAQPSAAAAAAQDGDKIVIAPGEYFDCVNWKANKLVIEGAGAKPEDTVITDKVCAGKGLFLISGQDITIRNLTLTRARVPDGNGAGIRMQANNLTVEKVRFVNNENGILVNNGLTGHLTIRDSTFVRNGSCERSCSHGLYVSSIDLLRIENTTFTETKRAHHIKSRAKRTEIINSTIQDGPTGTASYLIELPNGGDALIRGNRLDKGPKAENTSSAIMIGAEGVTQRTREILLENNTFRNLGTYDTYFVINLTAAEVEMKGNTLSGRVRPLKGDGAVH
ncbi:MAG: right-handed parallel beta-helix repeat-containing protein [Acetobacteraceae bacterium]